MVDLVGKRKYFFALSIVIIIAGIIGYFINGLQLDIQFQGGTIIEMQMNDDKFDPAKAEDIVKNTLNKTATAQKSYTLNNEQSGKRVDLLTINIASKDTLKGEEQSKLVKALREEFKIKAEAQQWMSVNNVQPFIGKELLMGGLNAVFWASILIIIYVWWRFKVMSGLSAGVMAVVALLHDVAIMLSVYTIFRIRVNDAFIAAVLTIIGYSMNDTIIIYDRIRENSNLLRKMPVAELVNKSIIQTLNRSINTVLTVLICIITVYIFAAVYRISSIKDFTLPLIIGITSGCYSSIFIASPLWVMWREAQSKKKIAGKTIKTSKA